MICQLNERSIQLLRSILIINHNLIRRVDIRGMIGIGDQKGASRLLG
jgi:hypothetical protein